MNLSVHKFVRHKLALTEWFMHTARAESIHIILVSQRSASFGNEEIYSKDFWYVFLKTSATKGNSNWWIILTMNRRTDWTQEIQKDFNAKSLYAFLVSPILAKWLERR